MNQSVKNKTVEQKLATRTYLSLSIVGLSAALLLTFLMLSSFKDILTPQVLLKSNVIAKSVQTTIADALKLGIPYDSLVGVEDYLSDVLTDNPEINFIQIKNQAGREYVKHRFADQSAQANENVIEETLKHDSLPTITVGLRKSYVNEQLRVMVGDAVVVSLVAFTVGLEIALFFVVLWIFRPIGTWVSMIEGLKTGRTRKNLSVAISGPFSELVTLTSQYFHSLAGSVKKATTPTKGNDWYEPKAYDLRLVLFLFVFSEELLRSFFPIYVKDIASIHTLISVDVDIALPIMSYMLFAGLGTVFGGGLVERLGVRNSFKWSVVISTIGLGGLAFATTVTEVVILRALCALGYAIATVSVQVFMTKTAKNEAERTRGLSTFVAAVTAASLSAAPIGAVIAQMLGTDAAMVFAAFLAVLSWFFFNGITVPTFKDTAQASASGTPLGKSFAALLKNQKIIIILISNVLSGKLMLAGLLFYLTPLLLLQFQFTQVSIGQFFMFYYLPLTLGNALLARYVPSTQARTPVMILGAILSGVGVLLLIWLNKPYALAIAIICLGVGQSAVLTLAPAILLTITRNELPHVNIAHTLSLVRTFDRIGGILGAAFAAAFSVLIDYRDATIGLGFVVLTLTLGNLALARRSNRIQ
jgi:MFS family permease